MTTQRKQILISVMCGLIAMVAMFGYTASVSSAAANERSQALAKYGGERLQVVVTTKGIAAGAEIEAADVEIVEWLADLMPEGDYALEPSEVVGQIAQVDLAENEVVLLSRVGDTSSRILVPDGLEAVSVSSEDVLAVGGAITAGSLVDVYVEADGAITQLGSSLLVLETSASSSESSDSIAWVTLAVTPESVMDLIAASSAGTLHFVLPGAAVSETSEEE